MNPRRQRATHTHTHTHKLIKKTYLLSVVSVYTVHIYTNYIIGVFKRGKKRKIQQKNVCFCEKQFHVSVTFDGLTSVQFFFSFQIFHGCFHVVYSLSCYLVLYISDALFLNLFGYNRWLSLRKKKVKKKILISSSFAGSIIVLFRCDNGLICVIDCFFGCSTVQSRVCLLISILFAPSFVKGRGDYTATTTQKYLKYILN